METTLEISGLNLEKLMSMAACRGIVLRGAERLDARSVRVRVSVCDEKALRAICMQFGWSVGVAGRSRVLRFAGYMKRRWLLLLSCLLFLMLVHLSSNMIWRIRIEEAGKSIGEIRAFLNENRIGPGTWKRAVPLKRIREALALRLPDLAYVGAAYQGSTMVIDCQPSLDAEHALVDTESRDIVALQDGIITSISAYSGTPLVQPGQAVCKGDVLIRGEERGEKESVHPVIAQGEVYARVWTSGEAKVSMTKLRTVETGLVRRRVTLCSPWSRRVIREARPFERQDVSVEIEPIVGLFLPFWRKTETFAEIKVYEETRQRADAASMAEAAAWQTAKFRCPSGVEILDKTVDYSMIDNEFLCATVVLEYERNIASRIDAAQ